MMLREPSVEAGKKGIALKEYHACLLDNPGHTILHRKSSELHRARERKQEFDYCRGLNSKQKWRVNRKKKRKVKWKLKSCT